MQKKLFANKREFLEFLAVSIFIIIGVIFRVLPHPPNFAPIAAIALFGGVYLSRKTALLLPLAALAISDIFIGSYDPKLMISVYSSFVVCVVLGFWLKKNRKWYTILGGSVLGAVLFFLITNFAVWAFSPWYPKNITGFVQCYVMALPFFRNTLLGDLFYVSLFFGAFEGVKILVKKISLVAEKEASLI